MPTSKRSTRGGQRSGESDYGRYHYASGDAAVPSGRRVYWRVSVVADTGDVYAQNTLTHAVRWLGTGGGSSLVPTPQTYREAETCFAGGTAGDATGRLLSHAEGGPRRASAPTEPTA